MKEQNIALIKKMYTAFEHGDTQTILNHLTDDVEWRFEGPPQIPYTGIRRGPQEVMGFFTGLAGNESLPSLRMEEFYGDGDVVITVGRYSATVNATGKSFDTALVHLFKIRDGKVCRFSNHPDTAAELTAYTR